MSNLIKLAMLLAGFALWAMLAYMKMAPVEPLIALLQMGLGGLVTHMLTQDGAAPMPVIPPSKTTEAGLMSMRLLAVLGVIAMGLFLSACTTVARGYEASAYQEIKASNDNVVSVWKVAACALPVGAVLRDPDIIDSINRFCGGAKSQLGANQPITVNIAVPAAPAASAPK